MRVVLETRGETGRLRLPELPGAKLEESVRAATEEGLLRGLTRIDVRVLDTDGAAIRALHRCGFRREGRLREAVTTPDGVKHDVLLYARLAGDTVEGQTGFSSVMDTVLPEKRVIGHVVFTDALGRVLLVEPTYKPDWELPGGIVEAGESPAVGARRELEEELGFSVPLGTPALVDWMPPYLGWSDAIEFIWHAGALPAGSRLAPPTGELRGFHWVDPAELPRRVTPLSARRIPLVLAATTTVFTVDGFAVDQRADHVVTSCPHHE